MRILPGTLVRMPATGPCPNCGGQLVQIERSGVRIDACRQCRGVFLDRGELDQILERERSYVASTHEDDDEFFREMSGSQGSHSHQKYGFDKNTAREAVTRITARTSRRTTTRRKRRAS